MEKEEIIKDFFKNRIGVLATMHKKETVISPILEKELGIRIIVPEAFNTDEFGTFTRDIERRGNQLETAKYKAEAVMELTGETLALASEGSFGPHPITPFLPFNREIVVFIDKENDLELIGEAATTATNFNHKPVKSLQEAHEFAIEAGFPEHGVVVKTKELSKKEDEIFKGITTMKDLELAVNSALSGSIDGVIHIETDMRALYNPTRMKNIEAATRDLVKKIYNLCPKCLWPGFTLVDRKAGLPCGWCGIPTDLTLSLLYSCKKCGYNQQQLYPEGIKKADPGRCKFCNP
ncbi:hypothetical protein F8154_10860 [Alkaliphilus pronyensis]|uniref:DUF6671 domain-containing protein n=1 Tax=Alkaliphilus pronyensis TaxID=1482732 RepID=A0A6I0EXD6_9FIRM|nr:DUF6671 family protein [Alkaliphilus pronyensis]KAB3533494.1 hypothetical protein F8154_10860 [Alkaliphilus pronyensis]